MKAFEKMTKKQLLTFILLAVCSGIMIGISGTASLCAVALYEKWGKLVGACLFSLGIYAIVTFEMKLFTGMVSKIPDMGLKNLWQLPVCFLGNILGVAVVALLVSTMPLGDNIAPQAASLAQGKLQANKWALSALCSSALCGALITLSVNAVRYCPQKSVSATVGVLFPIVAFAFCGFDHSVANVFYFHFLGTCSWKIIGYECVCILGNTLGGIALPLVLRLRNGQNK